MKAKRQILNWTMLISLIVVFSTGILVKPFPNMWLGIAHAVSGMVLFVTALIHSLGHMRGRRG